MEQELEKIKNELEESRESCDVKDKKIQELEMEVLRVSNRMAAMATDHAQQMQTLTDEIHQLKVKNIKILKYNLPLSLSPPPPSLSLSLSLSCF